MSYERYDKGVCMLHVRVGVCVGIRYMYELRKKNKTGE